MSVLYDAEIDGSLDAENTLHKAMELEVFCIFTDKILSAVGPWLQAVARFFFLNACIKESPFGFS